MLELIHIEIVGIRVFRLGLGLGLGALRVVAIRLETAANVVFVAEA
jgi:hypothetical protein